MPSITPRPATVERPRRAHRSARSKVPIVQAGLSNDCRSARIFNGEKNSGDNGNRGIDKETRRKSVAKNHHRAQGRNHRLNVEDHIHDGRVAVFSARVKKIVPTAEPANPEKIRNAQVRPVRCCRVRRASG